MANYDGSNMDKVNEDNGKFMTWVQTFSKKIVTVFSFLYVIIVIVMVSMLVYELRVGYTDGLSTMITEINETFRVVIGGYLIKAAVENGFKITGSYLIGVNKLKLKEQGAKEEEDSYVESFDEDNYDDSYDAS